jgi:hypothetical protein
MKTATSVTLSIVGIIAVIGLVLFGSYVHYYNVGAQQDALLKAKYNNMQNVLAQYSLKVTEAAQVPNMYSNDLMRVAKAAIQGRYGKNGSRATFQWIKEHNPNVDPAIFMKIQEIIQGGRDNFQVEQTQFLDIKREYQTELNSFWSGMWLAKAGYPKVPLSHYKLITSSYAQKAFKTGIDQGIKLPTQ